MYSWTRTRNAKLTRKSNFTVAERKHVFLQFMQIIDRGIVLKHPQTRNCGITGVLQEVELQILKRPHNSAESFAWFSWRDIVVDAAECTPAGWWSFIFIVLNTRLGKERGTQYKVSNTVECRPSSWGIVILIPINLIAGHERTAPWKV